MRNLAIWCSFGLVMGLLAPAEGQNKPKAIDQAVTLEMGAVAEITLKTDPEPTAQTTFKLGEPKSGTVTGTPPKVKYEPKAGFAGKDEFTFKVTVAGVESNEAKVSIDVQAKAPRLQTRTIEVTANVAKSFAADVEYAGDAKNLRYKVVTQGKHGKVAEEGDPAAITYTPEANFMGNDTLTLKVVDQETKKESEAVALELKVLPAKVPVGQMVEAVRAVAPGQYDPQAIKNFANCALRLLNVGDGDSEYLHECTPAAIAVSAVEPSTVLLELPEGVTKVIATSNHNWPPPHDDLNDNKLEFNGGCPAPGSAIITLRQLRRFKPQYGAVAEGGKSEGAGRVPRQARAEASPEGSTPLASPEPPAPPPPPPPPILRLQRAEDFIDAQPNCPSGLTLFLPGDGPPEWLKIDVYGEAEGGSSYSYSLEIRLLYHRWFLDASGFYALRAVGDDALVTRVVQPTNTTPGATSQAMTEVVRVREPGETSETGIMLTFFPANYPRLGASAGFAFPGERSPTYYLGFSYRVLNLRSAALATVTAGVVGAEVRAFPGVNKGLFDPNDPLLQGELDYEFKPFLALTLGFSLPNNPGK